MFQIQRNLITSYKYYIDNDLLVLSTYTVSIRNFIIFFRRTLVLAQELGDRAVEAQACYSLGNTYTLLRDYPTAIEYHLRHLIIAQQLMDRVGEGMKCEI